MHHNDVQFWRHLQSLPSEHPDLPTPRVCRLLFQVFERWKGRNGWLSEKDVGHLFEDRDDLTPAESESLRANPVIVRKSLAVRRMLELIVDPNIAARSGSLRIQADELLVGTLPPFSVGQGKEFVRYLKKEERLDGELRYLNELSPMGHIVPNHEPVLSRGLDAMAKDARDRMRSSEGPARDFHEAVAISLEAVISYADSLAAHTRAAASKLRESDPNRRSLETVAERLGRVPRGPARGFHDALQALFVMHCALHWTVEIVPIGRLDQLLQPYFEMDRASGQWTERELLRNAQELLDCFWIKLDERVILDPRHAENRFTSSDGVLTGMTGPSNYDQGGLLNQWMQQVTIGGVLPTDDVAPLDACNDVTRLCLHAARRLPLNSPTLDLRVHESTPDDVIELAAHALLSGGAHPVILNDHVIVPGLHQHCGSPIPLRDARNYACDGCYETMVAGASEFSFGFVSALSCIEYTLNRGAGLAMSGPIHLRGWKSSWRSKPASEIKDFAEFLDILTGHMQLECHRYLGNLLALYGNKASIAPSPLLSALIDGCIESGRDLTEGGARFHIFSPLLVGVSNAADSLNVIERLVFPTDPKDQAFTLQELATCLATDWGQATIEHRAGPTVAFGPHLESTRIAQIRELCLAQPKFGFGNASVDKHAWWLLQSFAQCVENARTDKVHTAAFNRLSEKYSEPARPFEIHLAPGVGTFEQYVFSGSFNSASADGRPAGDSIASDLSPAPIPSDRPACLDQDNELVHQRRGSLCTSLRSYSNPIAAHFADGMPVDYNVPEYLPLHVLVGMIRSFAAPGGGSICTFTAANPETLAGAVARPDEHNLIRVRMGGWSEFFIALFPAHQSQHMRRPLYE